MDVAHGEMVEKELTCMIEKRSRKEPDPDELEPSYAESVRRYHSRSRDERLWERLRYHEAMLEAHTRTFKEILERHKAGVSRCAEMLGIGESRG